MAFSAEKQYPDILCEDIVRVRSHNASNPQVLVQTAQTPQTAQQFQPLQLQMPLPRQQQQQQQLLNTLWTPPLQPQRASQPALSPMHYFNTPQSASFSGPSTASSSEDYYPSPHSSISSVSRDSTFSQSFSQSTGSSNSFALSTRRPSYLAEPYFQAQQMKMAQQAQQVQLQQPVFQQFNFQVPSYTPRKHSFPFSAGGAAPGTPGAAGDPSHSTPSLSAPAAAPAPQYSDFRALRNNSVDATIFTGGCYQVPEETIPKSASTADHFDYLDDGLVLDKFNNTIVATADLRAQFERCRGYFGDVDEALKVVQEMNELLGGEAGSSDASSPDVRHTNQLLDYLLTQNEDLQSPSHMGSKNYSLIMNKNGRLDIISFSKKSNLLLTRYDMIIIEGDRGRDLVMVLEPVIEFRFALFFNYLKKKQHLKSLEFGNSSIKKHRQTAANPPPESVSQKRSRSIINEDENFITLPNKQILGFAKPAQLAQLLTKYNEEVMALKICHSYARNLNLDLAIKNVEFQFDRKKLIIYYYCLQRIDFRNLIKELFKVYKTRIWLCAILPLEKGFSPLLDFELYAKGAPGSSQAYRSRTNVVPDNAASSDQLYSLGEIAKPLQFHSRIFRSLVQMFKFEISHPDLFGDRYPFLQ